MRQFLDKPSELRVEMELPDRPDKAQLLLFDLFHGFRFLSVAVDRQTDIISFDAYFNQGWSGQLVEDRFDLSQRAPNETVNCVARLRLAQGLQLTASSTVTSRTHPTFNRATAYGGPWCPL